MTQVPQGRVAPRTYERLTLLALVALSFIVVTGAAVRLTGSGLGCPDWPTCTEGRVVAPLEYHAMVEFVNRTVTGLVSVLVIAAVLGSLRREPRRRDLVWLSLGLVGGVLAQIVLGSLVVLSDLYPPLVMGHFVVSMALLADAVALHHRSGIRTAGHSPPFVYQNGRRRAGSTWPLVGMAGIVVALGTIVTGAGPHAGSNEEQLVERLPVAVSAAARMHGAAVWLFLLLTVATVVRLRRGATAAALRRAEVLLVAIVAQGAVGYVQYFTGVPPLLVVVHVAGSVGVWVAVLRLHLATRSDASARGKEKENAPTIAVPA